MYILTHPVNFPCGRKPECPEKTHDIRQSIDRRFSHESVARLEPTISEVKGTYSDDCATEAPSTQLFNWSLKALQTRGRLYKKVIKVNYS
jgi:hypothetical protein